MNKEVKETNGTIGSKIEKIYKWHNGLVMEGELNKRTGREFKYDPQKDDCYLFENAEGEKVILDKYGRVLYGEIDMKNGFSILCERRVEKTNQMISYFS